MIRKDLIKGLRIPAKITNGCQNIVVPSTSSGIGPYNVKAIRLNRVPIEGGMELYVFVSWIVFVIAHHTS